MKLVITADDGTACETEAEAQAIDQAIADMIPADEYGEALNKAGHGPAAVTRRVNVAKEFIAYLATEAVPQMSTKKDEKAAE